MSMIDPRGVSLEACQKYQRRVRLDPDSAADHRLKQLYERLSRPSAPRTVAGLERRVQEGDTIRVAGWIEQQIDPGGLPAGYRYPPAVSVIRALTLMLISPRK